MIRKKRCNKNGCREFVEELHEAYCKKHIGEVDRQYNKWRKESEPEIYSFYQSKQWKQLRARVMRKQNYLCQDCLENDDVYQIGDVCDHVVEIKDDWSKRLDENNIRVLCHSCHNFKTAEERKKRNS